MKSKLTSNKLKAPLAIDSEDKEIDLDGMSGDVSGGAPARGLSKRQPGSQQGRGYRNRIVIDRQQDRTSYRAYRTADLTSFADETLDTPDSKLNIK